MVANQVRGISLWVELPWGCGVDTNRLDRDKRVAQPLGFPIFFSRRGQSGSLGTCWGTWAVNDLQVTMARKEQSDFRSSELTTK